MKKCSRIIVDSVVRNITFIQNLINFLLKCTTHFHFQDGTIGSELIIRPLPERVLQEVVNKTPALHEPKLLPNVTRNEDLKHTSHHIVFKKVGQSAGDEYNDFCEYINAFDHTFK